ncbi:MAG: CvpA family protein [Candidatus Eremiobacteraeota bacterium]|nr:CvpA family protein [Candidatus Eremiobacteraeota bacterium]
MIGGVAWADVAIFAVLALTTARGYGRGFVRELAGMVALAAAAIVPWYYNGVLDGPIHEATGVVLPIAHLIGMAASSIVAYVIVMAIGAVLGRVKKIPVLGFGNALAGGAVGLVKGAVLIWIVLFVALFFPLTKSVRASLHASQLAPFFVSSYAPVDLAIENTIPLFARPFVMPIFNRHHV